MALWTLCADYNLNGRILKAGKTLSDVLYNIPLMQADGALLVAQTAQSAARGAQLAARDRAGEHGLLLNEGAKGDAVGPWAPPTAGVTPSGTGFVHVVGGVQDGVAKVVNLASADVTGVLPTANQAAQTIGGDASGTTAALTVTKLQGNTVAAGALSVGQLLVATGAGAWAATSVSGDVSSSGVTPGLLTVSALRGATVPAGGALTTGNVLQATGASALGYAPINLAGGANFVTGALPTANQAAQAMGGDVSGTTGAATVTKLQGNTVAAGALTIGQILFATGAGAWAATSVTGDVSSSNATPGQLTVVAVNGATVPAAGGALTTGNVLRVTGGGALGYGAVNLASAAAVTGLLPTANQAAQAMGGDVSGTTGAATVVAISGATPIAVTPNEFQWVTGATGPLLDQASTANATGANFTITPQISTNANGTSGNFNVKLGTPVGAGAAAAFQVLPASGAGLSKFIVGVNGATNVATLQLCGNLILSQNDSATATDINASSTLYFNVNTGRSHLMNGSGWTFHNGATPITGSGVKVIGIANATTLPTANPTGGGVLYVNAGALTWRGSSGTVTVLGPA